MGGTYSEEIENEADEFVEEYKEELTEIIKENKDRTEDYIFDEPIYQEWDLNSKIHEWVDSIWYGFIRRDFLKDFNSELSSYARILDECKEKETDSGLWDGQEPKEAIQTQAFFSVRNDIYWSVEEKIKKLIESVLE